MNREGKRQNRQFPVYLSMIPSLRYNFNIRSGVEDTRLEAKGTKKFRVQGQVQTLSRPRTKDTDASVFQKKDLQNFFSGDVNKGLQNFFSGEKGLQKFFFRRSLLEETKKRSLQIFRKVSGVFQRNFNGSNIGLSSSRGLGDFRGLEASRPRPRTLKCVLEAKDVLEDSTSVNININITIFYCSKHFFFGNISLTRQNFFEILFVCDSASSATAATCQLIHH